MLSKVTKYAVLSWFVLIVFSLILALMDVNISPYGGIFGLVIIASGLIVIILMLANFASELINNKEIFTAKYISHMFVESVAVSFFSFIALYWIKGEKEYLYSIVIGIVWAIGMAKFLMNNDIAD